MAINICPLDNPRCRKHIVCRNRRVNGKIIFPKNGKVFSFCLEDEDKAADPGKKTAA